MILPYACAKLAYLSPAAGELGLFHGEALGD